MAFHSREVLDTSSYGNSTTSTFHQLLRKQDPGLLVSGALFAAGGKIFQKISLNSIADIVSNRNQMIKGKKLSFTPILNSNWQGNHVGVSIGF